MISSWEWCANIREVRQISKVNAGGETEIAISGGSDIIKCNELENVQFRESRYLKRNIL